MHQLHNMTVNDQVFKCVSGWANIGGTRAYISYLKRWIGASKGFQKDEHLLITSLLINISNPQRLKDDRFGNLSQCSLDMQLSFN